MMLILKAQSPPLQADHDGIMRMVGTRVTLDTVVYSFNQGHSAEEIVSHYPALNLADVYAVISYYLNHRTEVNEYLQQQEQDVEKIWHEIENTPDHQIFRERLLTRYNTNANSSKS